MKKMYYILLAGFLFSISEIAAQTPYAHYPLDGNANDISTNNLDGTISGAPIATTDRYNQAGKALLFDGSNDYIDLPEDFDFPSRSVVLWFNASQIGSANGYNYAYCSDGPHLQNGLTNIHPYTDGIVGNIIKMSCDQFSFTSNIDTNRWYQVAVSRTPSMVKFYLNGTVVFTQANPAGVASATATTQTALIGADRGYNARFFGKIDDVRIYNTAINDTVVLNNYNSLKDIHEIDEKLKVYNERGYIVTKFTGNFDSAIESIKLFDLNGRIVSEKQGAFSGVLNETILPAGTYIVSVAVKNAERTISRKVIVSK